MRSGIVAVAVVAAAITSPARAQVAVPPTTTDTIRGRVVRPDSTPIFGATVTVTSAADLSYKTTHTDSSGAYQVVFEKNSVSYTAAVMIVGFAAQRRPFTRANGVTGPLVVNFLMRPAAQTLAAVHAIAERPRPRRDDRGTVASPGSTPVTLDMSSGMSGDLTGDINAALAMIPGVNVVPDGNGGFTVSIAGLGTDQNATTLNGMDAASGLSFRDGLVTTLTTGTYDPKRGRGAAGQISQNLAAGTATPTRIVHASLDDPNLQWTTPVSAELGTRYQDATLSGAAAGPIGEDKLWYASTFQARRRTSDLTTLGSANAASLQSLGVSRDSVARLLAIAGPLGLPVVAPGAPDERITTSVSGLARIDFTPAAQAGQPTTGHVFYLMAGGGWSNSGALGSGPTALASNLMEATSRQGLVMAHFDNYLFGSALNIAQSSFSVQHSEQLPYLNLPSASILMNSTLPNGTAGFSVLQAGGNGGTQSQTTNWTWETNNETSWLSWDEQHKFDIYEDVELNHFALSQQSNSLGSFGYNSLADFANGTPTSFTRTLSGIQSQGQSMLGTIAWSDIYTPHDTARTMRMLTGGGLAVQYGVRVDFEHFDERPAFNPLVDSLFGRRTDQVPNAIVVQPMVGFTYNLGTVIQPLPGTGSIYGFRTDTRHTFTGGIREYLGTASAQQVDNVSRQTGLPSATQQLQCLGSAVPTPQWGAYTQSQSAVPDACADGTQGTVFAQGAPPVLLYSPQYAPVRRWAGDLRYAYFFSGQLQGWVDGTYSLIHGQQEAYDLNFNPVTRFSLASEGGRPMFVSPSSIVPSTGAVAFTESRTFSDFAHVGELRSDLESAQGQAVTGLTYRFATSSFVSPAMPTPPKVNGTVSVSYGYTDNRAQSNGFSGTTAGDPRLTTWGVGLQPRHVFRLQLSTSIDRVVTLSVNGAFSSGFVYTPRVGSDINGDGYANDRAFVFNPATVSDPTLAAGMANLLASAPGGARSCLRAQVGTIAQQGSCVGPWNLTLGTISATFDSYRLGLGNRGSLVVFVNNLLGGVDQALHGDNNLRGWGQSAYPNQVLLNVKGFSPSTNQFAYTVNPLFGSTTASNNLTRPPFRISIDFKMDIGRDHETQWIDRFMVPRAGSPPWTEQGLKQRMIQSAEAGGFGAPRLVLLLADTLHLKPEQKQRVTVLRARLDAKRDSIYSDLAKYLIARNGDYGGEEVRARWHKAIEASFRFGAMIGQETRELLTDEQVAWLAAHQSAGALSYSPDWLERQSRGPFISPR